jgi:hypothetical protein
MSATLVRLNARTMTRVARRVLPLVLATAGTLGAQEPVSPSARDARHAADTSSGYRLLISLDERCLRVLDSTNDTVKVFPVAVGSGGTLSSAEHRWTFSTPRGIAQVLEKQVQPGWVAPDWHYIENARRAGKRLVYLRTDHPIELRAGRALVLRDDAVGILGADSTFTPITPGHDIVIGGVMFVPPLGSAHRVYPDILGPYRLLLNNGVGVHGTNEPSSVGKAATHGCIRLYDADITWLYDNVPIGTRVFIY